MLHLSGLNAAYGLSYCCFRKPAPGLPSELFPAPFPPTGALYAEIRTYSSRSSPFKDMVILSESCSKSNVSSGCPFLSSESDFPGTTGQYRCSFSFLLVESPAPVLTSAEGPERWSWSVKEDTTEQECGDLWYPSGMKRKKETDQYPLPREFRKSGSITYEGRPVELWLSRKTGELGFVSDGKAITDPERYAKILAYLQEANKES